MRISVGFLVIQALFLAPAFSQDTEKESEEFERILTEEEFVKQVVGKRLFYDSGAVIVFLEDRTFGGGFSGSRVWGEWVWREDRMCHQINIGEKRYKVECKVPQIAKKKLRFIREDGSSYGIAKIK